MLTEVREIKTHKINPLNSAITVEAIVGPLKEKGKNGKPKVRGTNGASAGSPTLYRIKYDYVKADGTPGTSEQFIRFHAGTFTVERGPAGVSIEALLAIAFDRLQKFQQGPYPSEENEQAMIRLYEAMGILENRARRMAVETAAKAKADEARSPEPTSAADHNRD
jgi:hypothetical protein